MHAAQGSTCRILAHRGANLIAPENTRSAFDQALLLGSNGIETDVQLSRDGVPVLWHDRFLEKIGMPDRRIDDFDFEQIKTLSFTGQGVTENLISLEEFLSAYRKRGLLDIEVKIRDWETLTRQQEKMRLTLQMVGASTLNDVFVSSFNLFSLIFANECSQDVPLFYILSHRQTAAEVLLALRQHPFLSGFCLPIALLDGKLAERLRAQRKTVVVYTCNSEADILKAFSFDVDILITDDPQRALKLRP